MGDTRRGSKSHAPRTPSMRSAKNVIQIEMPKLDLLIVGPASSGKTSMVKAFARDDEEQQPESNPLYTHVGMNVYS